MNKFSTSLNFFSRLLTHIPVKNSIHEKVCQLFLWNEKMDEIMDKLFAVICHVEKYFAASFHIPLFFNVLWHSRPPSLQNETKYVIIMMFILWRDVGLAMQILQGFCQIFQVFYLPGPAPKSEKTQSIEKLNWKFIQIIFQRTPKKFKLTDNIVRSFVSCHHSCYLNSKSLFPKRIKNKKNLHEYSNSTEHETQ